MRTFDVYSYGVVSSSTVYSIQGEFPAPEGYAEIDDVQYMTGGEATNSSVVLSRLGVRVKLDGNWLGDDDAGKRTKALLADYDIDSSRLPLKERYKGAREVIFAAQGTRTIFGNYSELLENRAWNTPDEDDMTQAKVICLDPFFGDGSLRVAETGCRLHIPVVTVDCRHDDPLLRHASAIVIAESFIRDNYAAQELEDLFQQYQANTNGLVIFTSGDKEIRFAGPDEEPQTRRPYSIRPVDTTGAGDAFRAGIVVGFLRKWDEGRMIAFAAAVAALVCTRFPGVLNAPSYAEVMNFMQSHRG